MTYHRILFLFLFISAAKSIPTTSTKQGCSPQLSAHNYNTETRNTSRVSTDVSTVKDKVVIKVYYETLCPFSMLFFSSQLKPAVARLGSHLDVHLIPYGHAKTYAVYDSYKFNCQHGRPECFGNMVQACAIDVLRNTTRAVYFNTCLMRSFYHSTDFQYLHSVFHWCAFVEKVNIAEMKKCMGSKRGSILLKEYGDETHAMQLSYVPYVLIDGSGDYQDQASTDLISTVCRMLRPQPTACFRNRY